MTVSLNLDFEISALHHVHPPAMVIIQAINKYKHINWNRGMMNEMNYYRKFFNANSASNKNILFFTNWNTTMIERTQLKCLFISCVVFFFLDSKGQINDFNLEYVYVRTLATSQSINLLEVLYDYMPMTRPFKLSPRKWIFFPIWSVQPSRRILVLTAETNIYHLDRRW